MQFRKYRQSFARLKSKKILSWISEQFPAAPPGVTTVPTCRLGLYGSHVTLYGINQEESLRGQSSCDLCCFLGVCDIVLTVIVTNLVSAAMRECAP